MNTAILLSLAFVMSVATMLVCVHRRSVPAVFLQGALILIYPVDAAYVVLSRESSLVASQPSYLIGLDDAFQALLYLNLFLFFNLCAVLALPRTEGSRGSTFPGSARISIGPLAVVLVLCLLVLLPAILEAGVTDVLARRQTLFENNALLLVVFSLLPTVSLYLLVASANTVGAQRALGTIAGVLGVGGTALLGSRSALLLSCLVPLFWYLLLKFRSGPRAFEKDVAVVVVAAAVIALASLSGSYYLSVTRDVQVGDASVLEGTDVAQFDALLGLIRDHNGNQPTYGAAATSFIPREIFPSKPLPGNVVSSLTLTPNRYELTDAETPAGLLGEGWINLSWLGALSSALLLYAMIVAAEKLLVSRNVITWVLGAVVTVRGLNLIRGDLTNVVAPLAAAVALWIAISFWSRRWPIEMGDSEESDTRSAIPSAQQSA